MSIYLFNSTTVSIMLMSIVLAEIFAIHGNQNKFMPLFGSVIHCYRKAKNNFLLNNFM